MSETDDHNAEVAEYAMGLLPASEVAAFEQRLGTDPALRALLADWQERLAALALDDVSEDRPPARLKTAIDARLFGNGGKKAGFWARFGRGGAVGAVLSLAMLIGLMVALPRIELRSPDYVAALAADGSSLRVNASYFDDGRLKVARVAGDAPEGRVLELWVIFEGEAPRSLGVLASASDTVDVPTDVSLRLSTGAILAISEEPPGGAPEGAPTGEILAVGPLTPA